MEVGERVLLRRITALTGRVERFLKKKMDVKWFKIKDEDQIRLLRLASWEEKYKLSVENILEILIPFWRARYSKYKTNMGIGIAIATLTGNKSEEFLRQKIKEEFPDGEHIELWKCEQQAKQWGLVWDKVGGREDWSEPATVIKSYRRRTQNERLERQKWAKEMRRRNYRGTPWK